jgi:hypothetical protein
MICGGHSTDTRSEIDVTSEALFGATAMAREAGSRRITRIPEEWRRRPDLNRGWRFCRPYRVGVPSAWLRLLVPMMLGSPWCLGVVAPQLLPRSPWAERRRARRPRRHISFGGGVEPPPLARASVDVQGAVRKRRISRMTRGARSLSNMNWACAEPGSTMSSLGSGALAKCVCRPGRRSPAALASSRVAM